VTRLRVLIVDDEPALTQALRRLLQRAHDVTTASDGRQALELLLAGERFDVILSDAMMPRMTGLELLEQLVQRIPEQARQFVLLSGGSFPALTRARLRTLGTYQLDKPVDVAALRSLLLEVAARAADDAVGASQSGH
jgi:CheY-like chemotaxis protein